MIKSTSNNITIQSELLQKKSKLTNWIAVKYLFATAGLITGVALIAFSGLANFMAFGIGLIITACCTLYHYHKQLNHIQKFIQNSADAIPITRKTRIHQVL